MIAQFKQDLYNKNFSLQGHGKGDENDTLRKIFKFRLNNINMGDQYLIMLMIMIMTILKWIFTSEGQGVIRSLEK